MPRHRCTALSARQEEPLESVFSNIRYLLVDLWYLECIFQIKFCEWYEVWGQCLFLLNINFFSISVCWKCISFPIKFHWHLPLSLIDHLFVGGKKWKSVNQSCLTLCHQWSVAHQTPLCMGFSRQEYWSGSPFCSPGYLPDPGIEPGSPALQADYQLSHHEH